MSRHGRAGRVGLEDARSEVYRRNEATLEHRRRWYRLKALERDVAALPPITLLQGWLDGNVSAADVLRQWRPTP